MTEKVKEMKDFSTSDISDLSFSIAEENKGFSEELNND